MLALNVTWLKDSRSACHLYETYCVRERQNGEIEAKQRGGHQKPIIQNEHLSLIRSLVEEKNDLLLRELCARFAEGTGIRVSIPTMHRAVEKLGWRCKKNVVSK